MKNMRYMNRQGGAVAVIVGISIFLLVGFLAMVIDLGHLYIAKTGLQNAADAAALSGAKELNETPAGVTSAKDRAIEAAGKNTFFGDVIGSNIGYQPVSLSEANIKFSNSPYTPDPDWISYTAALSAPSGLYFIKVDTGQQNLHTLFAVIWNIFNMSTYGRAVAGHLETPIAPIGICAINLTDNNGNSDEYGFRRGVSYSFSDVNNVLGGLGAGTELYLHPTATSSTNCTESGGNADFITPFLCTGKSAISGNIGSHVYTNTGLASCKALGAINTRFGLYPSCLDSSLNSAVCQPDTNIKQYDPGTAANWMSTTQPPLDQAVIPDIAQWLAGQLQPPADSLPASITNKKENQGGCKDGSASDCSDNYGVLWSYTRPVGAVPAGSTGWGSRYPSGPAAAGPYLASPAITCADPDPSHPSGSTIPFSPYCYGLDHTSNPTYFQAPSYAGRRDRRLVNVVIVRCPNLGATAPSGICGQLDVLGVGQFFLQTQAGGPRWISGEFVKLLSQPIPPMQIKLYQ